MNEIEAFGIADEWCEKNLKDYKWKIKSYNIEGDTAIIDVVAVKKPSIQSINVNYKMIK